MRKAGVVYRPGFFICVSSLLSVVRCETATTKEDDPAVSFQFKGVSGSVAEMDTILNAEGADGWDIRTINVRPEYGVFSAILARGPEPVINIEKVEIVVNNAQDPNQIAKSTLEALAKVGKKKGGK